MKPARMPPKTPAVVLGMFETGLAVGRSLGRAGVRVLGLDTLPKVGFRSRYIRASICPHPIEQEQAFIEGLLRLAADQPAPPALMITSDEFLLPVSRNRDALGEAFRMNLPSPEIVESIADKYLQHQLAERAGIPTPRTWVARDRDQLLAISEGIPFPAFIKGVQVTEWRRAMGDATKGITVTTSAELEAAFEIVFSRGISGLIQEVIPGPDTNHFKASCYVSASGETLLAFGLQKIRQQPAGFGFGCLVRSVDYADMLALGKQFFSRIGYRGVGSVEFKLDPRDGQLKLIELNPRFWQQNALADRCGMNFALVNYLDLVGANPEPVLHYRPGVKWVNLVQDLDSFREYHSRGELSFRQWLGSLRGEIVYSDLSWDDPLPGLHEMILNQLLRRGFRRLHSLVRPPPVAKAHDTQ